MSRHIRIIHSPGAERPRHPEKIRNSDRPSPPKPSWLKVRAPVSAEYREMAESMRERRLTTVCEEAACPNIGSCWSARHAAFMIMGEICTRACAFCNVATGRPLALDKEEPDQVAEMVAHLNLEHVVVTSVDRDDLPDGGADHFAQVIRRIRAASPRTSIEILTPDFLRKKDALQRFKEDLPDVFNHNIETIPRLYPEIRPGARYMHSLEIFQRMREISSEVFLKSGLMVGLGEHFEEVVETLRDLRRAGVEFVTIGQYLQPTLKHEPVRRFVPPEEFEDLKQIALKMGFLMVSASPLTRSSHHADRDFRELRQKRDALRLSKQGA